MTVIRTGVYSISRQCPRYLPLVLLVLISQQLIPVHQRHHTYTLFHLHRAFGSTLHILDPNISSYALLLPLRDNTHLRQESASCVRALQAGDQIWDEQAYIAVS
jgi:hypothetical protein